MEKEIWKDIKGLEGLYQVSNLGRVYSKRTKKYLKTSLRKSYPHVIIEICVNNNKNYFVVAKLIIETFLNVKNPSILIYKDGNFNNLNISNIDFENNRTCIRCDSKYIVKRVKKYSVNYCPKCRGAKILQEARLNLTDYYIKRTLVQTGKFTKEEITSEIIETKRQIIKIKRKCKELKS